MNKNPENQFIKNVAENITELPSTKKSRYINFPIILIRDASIIGIKHVCSKIYDYSLYAYTLKLEGSIEDKIRAAGDYYQIKVRDLIGSYRRGEILYNSIPKNNPKCGIRSKMILDFYLNDKKEFEAISFLAFCAIRSIVQDNDYCLITNKYLMARMAGEASIKDCVALPEFLESYTKRYRMDKLKEELQNNWGLKLYGIYTKGFYVSFKLDLYELGTLVRDINSKNIAKKKAERREIKQRIMKKIKNIKPSLDEQSQPIN